MTIRILLADDHKLLRAGLHALIDEQPNMKVIAETGDGRSAVQLAAECRPDIVIMDVSMPGMNGIEATRQICGTLPDVKVLALSMHTDRRFIVEMLNAGASGYLLKDCAFEEVTTAIHALVERRTYLSPKISDMVIKDYSSRIPQAGLSTLASVTPREREVIQLLAEGRSMQEIASDLKLSVKTVETYRQHIMEKLDIHTVAELTKFAIREGLTSL